MSVSFPDKGVSEKEYHKRLKNTSTNCLQFYPDATLGAIAPPAHPSPAGHRMGLGFVSLIMDVAAERIQSAPVPDNIDERDRQLCVAIHHYD